MERRIQLIQEMFEQTEDGTPSPQSPLMWETTFARIFNALNDMSIAKGNNHSGLQTRNFDIIIPKRLLLGRNNLEGSGRRRDRV